MNSAFLSFCQKYPRHAAANADPAYYHNVALSFSYLKEFMLPGNTPAHFLHNWQFGKEATRATRVGQGSHSLGLQGANEFNSRFVLCPDRKTTAGKEFEKAHQDTHFMLTAGEYETVQVIAPVIRQHPIFGTREGLEVEKALTWVSDEGIPLKACIDAYIEKEAHLIDVKTIARCEPVNCWWTAKKMIYIHQLAMYMWALIENDLPVKRISILWVQSKAPHLTFVSELNVDMVMGYIVALKASIGDLHACMQLDQWPGYTPAIWQDMETPPAPMPVEFEEDFEDLF